MGFVEAIQHVFRNYANFSGRARRSEYWWFTLFNSLVSGALARLSQGGNGPALFTALASLWSLALFLPGLALCWRRLHDIGKSGANWFWVFLPLVGWILLLVWMIRDGTAGPNQYGPDPKNPDVVYTSAERPPWQN